MLREWVREILAGPVRRVVLEERTQERDEARASLAEAVKDLAVLRDAVRNLDKVEGALTGQGEPPWPSPIEDIVDLATKVRERRDRWRARAERCDEASFALEDERASSHAAILRLLMERDAARAEVGALRERLLGALGRVDSWAGKTLDELIEEVGNLVDQHDFVNNTLESVRDERNEAQTELLVLKAEEESAAVAVADIAEALGMERSVPIDTILRKVLALKEESYRQDDFPPPPALPSVGGA